MVLSSSEYKLLQLYIAVSLYMHVYNRTEWKGLLIVQ